MIARNDLHDLADNAFYLVRECTAVGIAKDDPTRAFVISSLGAPECKFRICLIAIEEMFAVEQHLPALRLCHANALANRREVFLFGCLESNLDVVVPGLGHKADGVRLCFEQCGKTRIVGCRTPRPAGHAKCGESRAKPAILAEQFG